MPQRTLFIALLVAAGALLALSVVPVPAGEVAYALLAVTYPVLLLAVGARRKGRLGPAAVPLGLLLVSLLGSVVGMLSLRGSVAVGSWFLGLPSTLLLFILGLWLLPLLIVGLGYALTFDGFTLGRTDLDRLAELRRARREEG